MLKKYLPSKWKQFLWFLFKSPQRKYGGKGTLYTDMIGWFAIQKKANQLNPITICTGLKNRSKPFLEVLIPSLNKCQYKELITLTVFDCNSSDVANLKEEISKIWKGELHFDSEDREFARAYTFNKAIENSPTEIFFACDADMQVPSNLVELVNQYTSPKTAWFPISYHLDESGKSGKFKTEGKGIFASTKTQFKAIGKYNENYTQWGEEDWDLFFRFYKHKVRPYRTYEKELMHHYHPTLRPKDYQTSFK